MKRVAQIALRVLLVTTFFAGLSVIPMQYAWSAPATRLANAESLAPGATRQLSFPATHVVLRWFGSGHDSVGVRGRGLDGKWQDWIDVKPEAQDAADGVEGVQAANTTGVATSEIEKTADPNFVGERESDLLVVDNVVELQTRVAGGAPQNIRAAAIDTRNGPRHLEVVEKKETPAGALNGMTPQPAVISRASWGANESLRKGTPEFAPINRIIVHHTDTSNNDPDPAATVRAIYQWHTVGNGWNDIGYNFLIDQQGRIYEGRKARNYAAGENPTEERQDGQGVIGAHAMNANTGSIGISMLGNFTDVPPTGAQQNSLVRLMAWEADRHGIDPQGAGRIVGHRDVYQTACPGNVAYSMLPSWRQRTAAQLVLATTPGNTPGYTIAQADGSVRAFGSAKAYGSMAGLRLNAPVTQMSMTRDRNGYWLLGRDGGIFTFGNAKFFGSTGSMRLNAPVVGMAPTPSGNGYWLVASDGGIFTFGDAKFLGSMGGKPLNKPVVGMTASPSGNGYMLVASDGGIFNFGDSKFFGSTGSLRLAKPIVNVAANSNGTGYWLFADDGGVFSFGDVSFFGSVPMLGLSSFSGVSQAVPTSTNRGYYVLSRDGGIYTFGDARYWGAASGSSAVSLDVLPG